MEWILVPGGHSLNTAPRPIHTLHCGVGPGGQGDILASGALESRADEMQVSIFHSNKETSKQGHRRVGCPWGQPRASSSGSWWGGGWPL